MTSREELANRIGNLNVTYPNITQVWSVLDSNRTQKNNNPSYGKIHYFLIGPPGVGKSQIGLLYAERNPGYTEISEEGLEEIDIKHVVYLQLPTPFTIKKLYQKISYALGLPELSKRISIEEAQRQVIYLLTTHKVEVLILDELDYILTSNVKQKAAMNAIKMMANMANVTLVLMGTPEVEPLCNEEWCNLFKAIEKQLEK